MGDLDLSVSFEGLGRGSVLSEKRLYSYKLAYPVDFCMDINGTGREELRISSRWK